MKQDGTVITLKLTATELQLLTTLAADQLFRREFIDPKMPGYKGNASEMSMGKALLERLRSLKNNGVAKAAAPGRMAG